MSWPAAAAEPEPAFRILGPLEIGSVGATAGTMGGTRLGGRQACCLALLLLDANRVVSRASLTEALYHRVGVVRAEQDLHVVVSRLRRRLGELRLSVPVRIETVSPGYRFAVDPASLDAARFETAFVEAGRLSTSEPTRAERLLDAALDLWRGEVLADLDLPVHPAITRLTELRVQALERRYELALDLGRHAQVVADLVGLCRQHPFNESLWRLAMFALDRCGRQAEALALFQEARRGLVDGLGLEPGPQLIEAERLVLERRAPPPRATVTPQPPAAAPSPTRIAAGARSVLTQSATPAGSDIALRGRESELKMIPKLLGPRRVVTLTGPGGVGKTRLATEIARSHGPSLGGSVVCELSVVDAGDDVVHAIAARARVRLPPEREPLEALVDGLGNRRCLLVLDNAEHVVAAVRRLAVALTATCPHVTVLVTARVSTGVPGEQVVPVDPLAPDAAADLFEERAALADPSLASRKFPRLDVLALCETLDCLPLAIELAAARCRLLTPAEMMRWMSERRLLLAQPPGTGDARHRSLEASIEWSYRLLSADAAGLLRLCGAFAGWFDWERAALLAGTADRGAGRALDGDAVGAALAELIDASMLAVSRDNTHTHYRLLFTVRAFAEDRAREAGELAAVHRAHAQLTAERLAALVTAVIGPDEIEALRELDLWWPDARLAVARAVANGWTRLAAALVADLPVEVLCRERVEVRGWAEAVLALPGVLDQPQASAVLGTCSIADWGCARFDVGLERAEAALRLWREQGGPIATSTAAAWLLQVGIRADRPAWQGYCDEIGPILAADQRHDMALVWVKISEALLHGYAGRIEDGWQVVHQVEPVVRRLRSRLTACLLAMPRVVLMLDERPHEAAQVSQAAIEQANEVRATWFLGSLRNYLTAALIRAAEIDLALGELNGAIDRLRRGGSTQSVANTARNLLALAACLGNVRHTAVLVGWLRTKPISIAGTPGMRAGAASVEDELVTLARSDDAIAERLRLGGLLALDEAVEELARLASGLRSASPG